ncbi:unnamed protein product, partial [Polarella glacialis]
MHSSTRLSTIPVVPVHSDFTDLGVLPANSRGFHGLHGMSGRAAKVAAAWICFTTPSPAAGLITDEGFHGRTLLEVGLAGGVDYPPNVTIDSFTFAGCFRADVAAGALGSLITNSTLVAQTPTECAETCVTEAFVVGDGLCYCIETASIDVGAWQRLNESSCDAQCDGWSSVDFLALTTYFTNLSGFCGGSEANVFSVYEQYDAVMAVGQGAIDRTRQLWWQVVL